MDVVADPLALFNDWYGQARRAGIPKPHAMALATTAADGTPACRMVLLSSHDPRGFVFHTNYESRKGQELDRNARAALLFWWEALGYQIRIEGHVEKTSRDESSRYFTGRPRGNQLGAWVSEQTRPIESRAALEARMRAFEEKFAERPVPCPPHWGGYRVVPDAMEFWHERENRLHDRLRYERLADGGWRSVRLAP